MRIFVRVVALVMIVGLWTACVGDDPAASRGPAVGDRLGPCFPDGKCKEGLQCRDGEICLKPDEPKPLPDGGTAPVDSGGAQDGGGGSDSGPESGADAGPLECKLPSPTDRIPCGSTNCRPDEGEGCCTTATTRQCTTSSMCPSAMIGQQGYFPYSGSDTCQGTNLCCLAVADGSSPAPTVCAQAVRGSSSSCSALCNANNQRQLCDKGSTECGALTCMPTEILLGSNPEPVVWGLCW